MPKILVADDHPLFRKALRSTLRAGFFDAQVAEAETLAGARACLGDDVDLVLLDLSMPDCGGFDALVGLRAQAPAVPIIVVSAAADVETVRGAARCGAAGFIPKTAAPEAILRAIRAVLAGGESWPVAAAEAAAGEGPLDRLSASEARVLALMVEGKPNKQIAYELGVKESTVKSHVTALLRKLDVHSRTQAVLLAKGGRAP